MQTKSLTNNILKHDCSELVTSYLIDNSISISFMESCTSGLLASKLTDTEGASAIFKGSYVTYSNDQKIKCGVDSLIIDQYGVYSKECANSMANATYNAFMSDISIGITGNTGNIDPNNPEGIVGEAYYSIKYKNQLYEYHVVADVKGISRKDIKRMYAYSVYESLKELLEL